MRILIIEDDRDAAAYLVKAFREAGYSVDHAADGVSGYDLAQEGGHDVAIVDRMLPKMDGLALIGALRAHRLL
jgi:two-component system OmpR family response regulator